MAVAPPVVLTIAGFDPSSGAGVTADIKTIAAHDCFGVACITAATVQSTRGVRRVEPLDPELISQTLEELASDLPMAAVHIGMLGSGAAVKAVADFLRQARLPHVVLDPVLKSSSGASLLDDAGTRVLIERLVPLSEVITPNLEEAMHLAGREVSRTLTNALDRMRATARHLHALGAGNVVVTGGGEGSLDQATDLLSVAGGGEAEQQVFRAQRVESNSTHGTGCAFSTALACHLAHGRALPEAVLLAKVYVSAAIANAYPLGHGVGPLHHLYRMAQKSRAKPSVVADEQHSRR
jgi:hydroxymethylpyrimidine/phosphomethylpyrimidine kinase